MAKETPYQKLLNRLDDRFVAGCYLCRHNERPLSRDDNCWKNCYGNISHPKFEMISAVELSRALDQEVNNHNHTENISVADILVLYAFASQEEPISC